MRDDIDLPYEIAKLLIAYDNAEDDFKKAIDLLEEIVINRNDFIDEILYRVEERAFRFFVNPQEIDEQMQKLTRLKNNFKS